MKKILSIDGGGVRGLIPALILTEIERKVGKPIASIFDIIAGTSVGGLVALIMAKNDGSGTPQYRASDAVGLFDKHAHEIFSRSFWRGVSSVGGLRDEKYSAEPIESVLKDYLGDDTIGSALTNVLISSYELEERHPYFFKSWADRSKDVLMRHAARATSAAPLYFEPAHLDIQGREMPLIDGGVFVNNPAMCAYAEALRIYPDDRDCMVLSLGTGELTRPIPFVEAKDWGLLEWAGPILNIVFDGVSDAVDYQLHQILNINEQQRRFFRFQTRLDKASDDLDDASPANMAAVRAEAQQILDIQGGRLDEVCELLKQGL